MSDIVTKKKFPFITISGPSGAGKDTLRDVIKERLGGDYKFVNVISHTTRPARGEDKGVYDHFSLEDFDNHEYLEHANVHGDRYGTPLKPLLDAFESGVVPIKDLDIKGIVQMHEGEHLEHGKNWKPFLILPPGETVDERLDVLRKRLVERGESDEKIERRMQTAREEFEMYEEYAHLFEDRIIVNDDLNDAGNEMVRLVDLHLND